MRIAKKRLLDLCLAFSICLLPNAAAVAHDTWLVRSGPAPSGGKGVWLDLASGVRFPNPTNPIGAERIEKVACRRLAGQIELSHLKIRGKTSSFRIEPPADGTLTCWVSTRPKFILLKAAEFHEYLREVGLSRILAEREKRGEASLPASELYTKHAKAIFGTGAPDETWRDPVGMRLEIVPEKDPTRLSVGEDLPVLLLYEGKPLSGLELQSVPARSRQAEAHRTDAAGRAVFRPNRIGQWLLRGTHMERSPGGSSEWHSHFTTLTFEIR